MINLMDTFPFSIYSPCCFDTSLYFDMIRMKWFYVLYVVMSIHFHLFGDEIQLGNIMIKMKVVSEDR